MIRLRALPTAAALAALAVLAVPSAQAVASDRPMAGPPRVGAGPFPASFPLPDGFQPEGIATGPGPFAYFGSLADGSIYRASLVTGNGSIISEGPGTPSVGVKTDPRGRLFVSGGPAGDARVVDTRTGDVLASYQFATGDTFVNDVVLTEDAAYFTDSRNPVLYKLPLDRGGGLPSQADVVELPLTGDLVFTPGFNTNGIARTPDHQALVVVQSSTGRLFRVDPASGVTTAVDLGGETVPNGDGLLLDGRTLYVVQNRLNTVAVVRMNPAGTAGEVVERVTDPRFDVPTTVAAFGDRLYLPNARFGTPPQPDTPYTVNAIPRPRP